jgi:hypothetical protein
VAPDLSTGWVAFIVKLIIDLKIPVLLEYGQVILASLLSKKPTTRLSLYGKSVIQYTVQPNPWNVILYEKTVTRYAVFTVYRKLHALNAQPTMHYTRRDCLTGRDMRQGDRILIPCIDVDRRLEGDLITGP